MLFSKKRSTRRLKTSGLTVSLLGLLLGSSCASLPEPEVLLAPPSPYQALVVNQVIMEESTEAPFEAFKRTLDVLNALWEHTSWRVIQPNEYRFIREEGKIDFSKWLFDTNLVALGKSQNLDPKKLLFLTITVTERVAQGGSEISGEGSRTQAASYKKNLITTLEAFDAEGQIVARIVENVPVDPFAQNPEYDSTPGLKEALFALIRSFESSCSSCIGALERTTWPVKTSPGVLFQAQTSSGETLYNYAQALDPLDRELLLWRELRYVDPSLKVSDLKNYQRVPSGLCLGDDAVPPFRPHDCIHKMNGRSLLGRHELARSLERGAIELEIVGKDGRTRSIRATWPE